MNTEQLKNAKLFDVTALANHLLENDYYLLLNRTPNISLHGRSSALFSLYYGDDIKQNYRNMPLPDDISYTFKDEVISQAPISEIMEYLINNDIIQDVDLLQSWNEHIEWHTELDDLLFSACIADFVYPECYSREFHEYSSISIIQLFAELFICITEVSFCPSAMEVQNTIINEALPFIVDELIPVTIDGMDEVSVEKITDLVQKISVYLSKLFWIYTL